MRFGVLGPLAAWTERGRDVEIPGAKVRALLAHLLVHHPEPVSADRLLADLWDGEPPAHRSGAVQTAVSRLRRALEEAEPGARALVASSPSGYRLLADREAVDSARFTDLLASARTADSARDTAARLTEALALWRGPALADHADAAFAMPAAARWEEQRAAAREELIAARLRLGEHASLIGELDELVERYPLRERLRTLHMRALYGAGRQAEALDSFRRIRAVLSEEVGVDPGPELTSLHQAMLEQAPELVASPEPEPFPAGRSEGATPPAGSDQSSGRAVSGAASPEPDPASSGSTTSRPASSGVSPVGPAEGMVSSGRKHMGAVSAISEVASPDPDPRPPGSAAPRPAPPEEPPAGRTEAAAPAEREHLPTPGNVTAPLTEVVGRDAAIAEVRGLLDDHRLVTLTGPGGVGKTTLALAATHTEDPRFPDGTWLVELNGCDTHPDDPDCVAELVAAVLRARDDAEVPDGPDTTPLAATPLAATPTGGPPATAIPAGSTPPPGSATARLARTLHGRRMLLVLDNIECLAGPAARFIEALLRAAPDLRVLTTGREPLGLPGERLHRVRPLDPPGGASVAEVERSSAARLFARRAVDSDPGFAVDTGNAAAVAEICRRLDGLPLALELAAARLRALTVWELAARLDDRFRLLAATGDAIPPRQRTLRAMIDWSWEPLSAAERAVLARLSVHPVGASLAAAEAVCSGPGVDPADVLGILARLIDRSLVVNDRTACGSRYRMLESVAAYAYERLVEAGEAEATRERHARHWAGFAARAHQALRGRTQREVLDQLDTQGANMNLAIEWAVDHGEAGLALRAAGGLGWYWYLRGRGGEGYRRLATALAVPGPCTAADRAYALAWQAVLADTIDPTGSRALAAAHESLVLSGQTADPGWLAEIRTLFALVLPAARGNDHAGNGYGGSFPSARPLADAAQDTFRRLDDRWGLATALYARGWDAMRRSDLALARADAEESYDLFLQLEDPWGQVRSSNLLGVLAEISGDYERAGRLHRAGLDRAEEIGLAVEASEALSRLGRIAMVTGDFDAADRHHEEALRRAREASLLFTVSYARTGLAMTARRRGDLDRAETELRENLALHTAQGYQSGRAAMLAELGFAAEMRGDAVAARALHLDGLTAALASEDPRAVAQALEGVAGADTLTGTPERAACLLGAADAARRSVGAPRPGSERFDVDRIGAAARAALGDDAFTAAFRHGEGWALADAVARARAEAGEWTTVEPTRAGRGAG